MIDIDRIYNEDCWEGMKRIPDGSIDLIVTDPPYIVSKIGGGSVNAVKKLNMSLQELDKAKLRDGYDIAEFSKRVTRLQGGKVNAYFWCNKVQMPEYFKVYVDGLKCRFDIISWHKKDAMPTFAHKYLSDTEYCLYFTTGGFNFPASYEDAKTYEVGSINRMDKKLFGHPTIKPLNIIRRIIRNSSRPGQLVLDPFIGSGTTAVACLEEGRHFIGFELDVDYFNKSMERVNAKVSELNQTPYNNTQGATETP